MIYNPFFNNKNEYLLKYGKKIYGYRKGYSYYNKRKTQILIETLCGLQWINVDESNIYYKYKGNNNVR